MTGKQKFELVQYCELAYCEEEGGLPIDVALANRTSAGIVFENASQKQKDDWDKFDIRKFLTSPLGEL